MLVAAAGMASRSPHAAAFGRYPFLSALTWAYPGKRKLIVCGFHEATLAGFAAAALLRPDTPVHVQYTTTSALLQHRLGVTPDVK